MSYEEIELKHSNLIDIAKEYMKTIDDSEHDINHMNDVVEYTKKIMNTLDEEVNIDACLIGAYWHDVGRTKIQKGHEEVSSQMLASEMELQGYEKKFIDICSESIKFHKWDMTPQIKEGWVIKDADKLAWVGTGRWNSCVQNNQRLDELIRLLPSLRDQILHFECTKKLYDEEIVKIVTLLYTAIYDNDLVSKKEGLSNYC